MPRPHSTMEYTVARRAFLASKMAPYYCHYCGCIVERTTEQNPKMLTVDHFKPLQEGGCLDDVENFRVACYKCNQKRGRLFDLSRQKKLSPKFLYGILGEIKQGKLNQDFLAHLDDRRTR